LVETGCPRFSPDFQPLKLEKKVGKNRDGKKGGWVRRARRRQSGWKKSWKDSPGPPCPPPSCPRPDAIRREGRAPGLDGPGRRCATLSIRPRCTLLHLPAQTAQTSPPTARAPGIRPSFRTGGNALFRFHAVARRTPCEPCERTSNISSTIEVPSMRVERPLKNFSGFCQIRGAQGVSLAWMLSARRPRRTDQPHDSTQHDFFRRGAHRNERTGRKQTASVLASRVHFGDYRFCHAVPVRELRGGRQIDLFPQVQLLSGNLVHFPFRRLVARRAHAHLSADFRNGPDQSLLKEPRRGFCWPEKATPFPPTPGPETFRHMPTSIPPRIFPGIIRERTRKHDRSFPAQHQGGGQ
jgi:hypothetical protein